MTNEIKTEVELPVPPVLVQEGRKLVTIRKIAAINAIPGADNIVEAEVDGWAVVIKKGEFEVGDYCAFFEVDCFLPADDSRYAFLLRNGVKVDEKGKERIRLKTIRLRKTLSQGLALPVNLFPEIIQSVNSIDELYESGFGIEQFLNVTKYERPSERNGGTGSRRAKTASDFPWWCRKTDAERLQNVYGKYKDKYVDVLFRPSLKMDGSSTTIAYISDEKYKIEKLDDNVLVYNEETQSMEVSEILPYPFNYELGTVIVCSRNLVLKHDPTVGFWKAIDNTQIHESLKKYCEEYDRQLAIQAELVGPGVNGNWDKHTEYQFYAFHIWDIDKQEYIEDEEFQEMCTAMQLQQAPQFPVAAVFQKYKTLKEFLEASDIPSVNNPIAEGIVYKSTKKIDGQQIMFKVINNKYLLSEE